MNGFTGIKIWATSADGLWSVIEAKDYQPGIGRSRTRDTPGDALKAPYDPNLTTPVGPGSLHKFVMVRTMDLGPNASGLGGLLSPKSYMPAPGNPNGKFIPHYPHTCLVCGGKCYQGFMTTFEHEGGACPGPAKKQKERWA